jgi:hypothetical protein
MLPYGVIEKGASLESLARQDSPPTPESPRTSADGIGTQTFTRHEAPGLNGTVQL